MVIYVGNFPVDTTEDELRATFELYGQVENIHVIYDRFSERGLGFGFISMPIEHEAKEALYQLNHTRLGGRTIMVQPTAKRTERRLQNCEGYTCLR